MSENNNNFFFAIILCLAVMLGWQYFVIDPQIATQQAANEVQDLSAETTTGLSAADAPLQDGEKYESVPVTQKRALVDLADSPRVKIKTPELDGSIALIGARLDMLFLSKFPLTLNSEEAVKLLQPETDNGSYWQVMHGWIGRDALSSVLPNSNTLWEVESGDMLTPDSPVTLKYAASNGLTFRRKISIDNKFMFTIAQSVTNESTQTVSLYPYGQISRRGTSGETEIFVLHEGGVGVLGDEDDLHEVSYSDLIEDEPLKEKSNGGWLGLTDKYWATALIPPQNETFQGRMSGAAKPAGDEFRTDYLLGERKIAVGATASVESRLFAGAKLVDVIDSYNNQNVTKFDLLIDWGWFYFLTKPMFSLLSFFYELIGNYGVSILLVTVVIKLVFFPLANKSYATMAKMKRLQPEMTRLREVYADDKKRQQQELIKLYREEKLNPMAGCLPMLIQIPVFFSLYKVLYVTIDMRHQPFFGWIQDLSVPDPTSLFNLFGIIPWDPPSFLIVGIWPIIMGITMFAQMQMNPPAPDPLQRQIFAFMPLVFTFLLASFPAGLVIYWAWNNFLSVIQQGYIMKRNGVKIELLGNLGVGKKSDS